MQKYFGPSIPKGGGEKKEENLLQSFFRYTQTQQEVGDNLSVCVLNLLPKVTTCQVYWS